MEWIANNVGSILLSGISAVISWGLAVRYKDKKALSCATNFVKIFEAKNDIPKNLKMSYDNLEIDCLSKTTFNIWNSGTTTINGNEIIQNDRLRVYVSPEYCILEIELISKSRDACDIKILKDNNNCALISFDFLDKNDGIIFSVLHNSNVEPLLTGTIKGLHEISNKNLAKLQLLDRKLDFYNALIYSFIIVSVFFTYQTIFTEIDLKSLQVNSVMLSIVSVLTFLSVCLGILLIPINIIIKSKKSFLEKKLNMKNGKNKQKNHRE